MPLGSLLRRLAALPVSLLAVTTAVFVMMRILPGDPVVAMLVEAGASPSVIQEWQERYRLLDPLPVQYWHFLLATARGDLGRSISYGRPVLRVIGDHFSSTVELAFASFGVATVVGGTLGVLSARYRGSPIDVATRLMAVGSASLPTYWTGIMAILLFAAELRWLPSGGEGSWQHLLLPSLTLGIASAGVIARLVRASLLEVGAQAYVQVARAKGLQQWAILRRHVLRAAAAPIVTLLGLQVGFLLAGTAITETVFSRRGIGRLLVEGITSKDYPLVQGCMLLVALVYVLANAVGDAVAASLDPRARER